MKYTNIKCNEEHQKVFIPEETRKKIGREIKRAFLLLEVPLFVLTSCSGLRETRKDINDVENPGHSYIDTDDETKDNSGLDITFKDDGYKNQDVIYDQLVIDLNAELDKKDFSEEARGFFEDTLDSLYKNYPEWQKGYRDLPNREKYIKENLINIVKKIDNVEIYDINSKEAKDLLEEGSALAWTECAEDGKLKVSVIAAPKEEIGAKERNEDVELFYHEIIHCKQKDIIFYSDYFKSNEDVEWIFTEGGATFHMKFVEPLTTEIGGTWSIANEKGISEIQYSKDNCLGYLVELNAYEKIVYLVGYDAIDKIETGELPFTIIQEKISEKYGKEKADEILETMGDWYTEYNNNWKGDNVYNLSVKLERVFLECVKQDIGLSKTEEDFKNNVRIYEHYKSKNLPTIEGNAKGDVFGVEEVDKTIKDKAKELGLEQVNNQEQADCER